MTKVGDGPVKTEDDQHDNEGPAKKTARLINRPQYPLRMPTEIYEEFQQLAALDNVTLHAYLIQILTQFLRDVTLQKSVEKYFYPEKSKKKFGDRTQYPLRMHSEMRQQFQILADGKGLKLHDLLMHIFIWHWANKKLEKHN